ncbi:hypothetical protein N9Y42_05460 [Mariniblastus sp.]|nr:hypothetical protein [Mariniblastus sp.]
MKQIDRFIVGTLISCYRDNPAIQAIFHYLYEHPEEPPNGVSKVGDLQQDLSSRGVDLPLSALREALEKMANAGCGEFNIGRPSEESSLVWKQSAKDTAACVLGKGTYEDLVQQIESFCAVSLDAEDIEFVHPEAECNTHYFPTAAGSNMPVRIPCSFDATQVHNLADFLHVVAKSMS